MKKLAVTCVGLALLVMSAMPSKSAQAQVVKYSPRAVSEAAIHWASARWNVSYWWLWRIAMRESGLNPSARNPYSGAMGLFQFMPATYYAYARRVNEWRSPYNAYANANVAAYMFHAGLSYAWN